MDKYIKEKATNIKAILTDVDGVLTDGKLIYDHLGNISKNFNVKDGQLIKYAKSKNIILGAITGRKDNCVDIRIKDHLKFDFYIPGSKNKISDYENFKKEFNLKNEEICFIGDDLIDLDILNICGLSISPSDAIELVKEAVDYVSQFEGGKGVFRDAINIILEKNIIKDIKEKKVKF